MVPVLYTRGTQYARLPVLRIFIIIILFFCVLADDSDDRRRVQ